MPIYEYECTKHGRFEYREPLREGHCEFFCAGCPVCGEISDGVMSSSSFVMGPYGAMSPAARKLYDVSKPAMHREV